jgi:hypothetical protein
VGNTDFVPPYSHNVTDHPHGCGEHPSVIIVKLRCGVKLFSLHYQLETFKVDDFTPG